MPERRTSRRHWPAATIALAGAGLLFYWWRLAKPLWVDEETIALNARWRSFPDLAGALWLDQSAPFGWLAIQRTAFLLFGVDERAARAQTVLWGIGTLIVAFWIGRRWMGPLGAAILAALCAIGPWLVFFTLELKHYSADACWALLLPALAAWATETDSPARRLARHRLWWVAAASGLWLSNGAMFVAPGCVLVLAVAAWRRGRVPETVRVLTPGVLWLASFGLDYVLVLRHALGNAYLDNYWSFAFPPVAAGIGDTLTWTGQWLRSFPIKPVGTGWWAAFWVVVIAGYAFAISRWRAFGAGFALVPVAAVVLALLQIVPPFERLGLWCVPALYVGLSLGAEGGVWLVSHRVGPRVLHAVGAPVVLALAVLVCYDVVRNGLREIGVKAPDSNYGLDDRRAIRHVQTLRQSGDVVLTTHFGLAALWWYGGVNIADVDGGALFEDSPVFEMSHQTDARACDQAAETLDRLSSRSNRLIVYLGFRMNVLPEGFDRFALEELSRRGALVAYNKYADLSYVAAFDMREQGGAGTQRWLADTVVADGSPLPGCLVVRPARRW
jgi:hypothetical protein